MIWLQLLESEVSMGFIVQSYWWWSTHEQHSGHLPESGQKTCTSVGGKSNLCNLKQSWCRLFIAMGSAFKILVDSINPCSNLTWIVIDCKWNIASWLWVWNLVASQLIWMSSNSPVIKRCIVQVFKPGCCEFKRGLRSKNSILGPMLNLEGVNILQLKAKLCQEENGFDLLHHFNYQLDPWASKNICFASLKRLKMEF